MIVGSIEPIFQKSTEDCGIAALAMLLQESYRSVSEIAMKVCKKPHERGMYITDLVRTAKSFGRPLLKRALFEDATGILVLRRTKKRKLEQHFVVLFQGVLVNPADGLIWDLDTFLARGKWKAVAILERIE